MKNKLYFIGIGAAATVGFLGGLYLGNAHKNLAQSLGFGIGGALLGGGAIAFYYDTKLNRVRNSLINSIGELTIENTKLKTQLEVALQLKLDIEKTKQQALQTISENVSELSSLRSSLNSEQAEGKRLQIKIDELLGEVRELNQLNNDKEAQLQEFTSEFNNRVTQEFETRKDKLVGEEVNKEYAITLEAFSVLEEMQGLLREIHDRHQSQREFLLGTHSKYGDHLSASLAKKDHAYQLLSDVRDSLELRVRILEQTIADGLTQPIKGNYGIASKPGMVINAFIDWCYLHLQIPFKALQFDDADGITSFGLDYPKSQDPKAICELLQQNADTLKNYLGVWNFTRFEYLPKYDAIGVSYRHEPPKPDSDETIYKLGLIPAALFCDQIFKATDHKSKGKPTLRIMSATGGGKGIATKNIVAYFAGLVDWETWVSDPLHGSEEDHWDCDKVAKSPAEASQAYSQFIKLHKDRQAKRPAITDRFVLGIFDEFDKQHDDDDKKYATEIMTAIRHTKQRQILIGQSGEVGSNHWTWDAMKNCSMLFIEDAIGTALKHDKDLGWSLAKKRELQKQYEKFAGWALAKNESLNLSSENAHRIALLVVGDRCTFLEVPSAHKGILRDGLGIIRANFDNLNSFNPENIPTQSPVVPDEIECPHCQSNNFRRHSAVKQAGKHRYSCNDCNKSFVARDNKIN